MGNRDNNKEIISENSGEYNSREKTYACIVRKLQWITFCYDMLFYKIFTFFY